MEVEEDDDQATLGVEEDQDQAAFGVERSKQGKLDMELDTELKIKQNLRVGDRAHIILS